MLECADRGWVHGLDVDSATEGVSFVVDSFHGHLGAKKRLNEPYTSALNVLELTLCKSHNAAGELMESRFGPYRTYLPMVFHQLVLPGGLQNYPLPCLRCWRCRSRCRS